METMTTRIKLPLLEQIDMRAIDWTERKPFMYKGETVYFDFEELLTAVRKPFRSLMYQCFRDYFSHYADLWQMCSIFCIRVYVGGVGLPYHAFCCKAFRREILQYINRERRHEGHISLNPLIGEGEDFTLGDSMVLAVYDKLFKQGLDWSAFTDEENAIIDQILRFEPYKKQSVEYVTLRNKLEQYRMHGKINELDLSRKELDLIRCAEKKLNLSVEQLDELKKKRILWYANLSVEQRDKYIENVKLTQKRVIERNPELARIKERLKWERKLERNPERTREKARERSRAWYVRKKAQATATPQPTA